MKRQELFVSRLWTFFYKYTVVSKPVYFIFTKSRNYIWQYWLSFFYCIRLRQWMIHYNLLSVLGVYVFDAILTEDIISSEVLWWKIKKGWWSQKSNILCVLRFDEGSSFIIFFLPSKCKLNYNILSFRPRTSCKTNPLDPFSISNFLGPYILRPSKETSWVVRPILSTPFQSRTSWDHRYFDHLQRLHGSYLRKKFFILFSIRLSILC